MCAQVWCLVNLQYASFCYFYLHSWCHPHSFDYRVCFCCKCGWSLQITCYYLCCPHLHHHSHPSSFPLLPMIVIYVTDIVHSRPYLIYYHLWSVCCFVYLWTLLQSVCSSLYSQILQSHSCFHSHHSCPIHPHWCCYLSFRPLLYCCCISWQGHRY